MSTLTEQIAAVKRVIEECESNGYDDFKDDPHTFGHLTAMRAVLATLEGEGMAAPEPSPSPDYCCDNGTLGSDHVCQKQPGDSPSPQQPTQEAIKAANAVFICTMDRDTRENIAWALDRFAAQRVTAATASEREARHKCEAALRAKDVAMGVLFERLISAGVDCSDLIP